MIIPTLENWAPYHEVLIGEAYNHPQFEQRQRVATNRVIKFDLDNAMAVCLDNEVWQLGRQGKLSRYIDPVSKRFF